MRQPVRANSVVDSEIPGGLDVFFDEIYVARDDVVDLDSNELLRSQGKRIDGDIYTETGDPGSAGTFQFATAGDLGRDPELGLDFEVDNKGSTSGGLLGDGNPDSCEGGDGTAIRVVVEVDTFVRDDSIEGERLVAESCIPDKGILGDVGVGFYRTTIPSEWLSGMEVGDTITFKVWAEGSNTGTRVTPIYRIEGVGIELVGDGDGGAGGGGDNGDETDDGSGGGTAPAFGSDFTVTNREWFEEDGEIVVSVTIEGGEDGGAQNVPATFYIDGNEFADNNMAGQGVAPGETDTAEEEIELAEIEPGDHLLEVEVGDAGVLEVDQITVEEQPSGDPAQQLSIENCDVGKFGSGAAVSADIANNSEFPITTDVEILVDGQAEATIDAVTIAGGQSQPISQQVSIPSTPGDYAVSIQTVNETFD